MARNKNISVGVKIDGEAKGFKSASEDAKKASKNLALQTGKDSKKMGGFFGSVGNKIGGFGQKMGGVIGQVASAISGAMKILIANPVVAILAAIVLAFTALMKIIKSTDSGATEFAVRMEQLKAIFDILKQRVLKLTKAIGLFFKGKFKASAKAFGETFAKIGDEFKTATDQARKYVEALDDIQNSQDNFISQRADMENQIAKLELRAETKTLSKNEQRKALVEAMKLKDELAKIDADYSKRKLDEELKFQASKRKFTAQELEDFIRMTDEEQSTASEALQEWRDQNETKSTEMEKLYSDMIGFDTAYAKSAKENQTKISTFDKEVIDKKKADKEKGLADQKVIDDKEKALAEKQAQDLIEINREVSLISLKGKSKEVEALKQQMDDELAAVEGNEAAIAAVKEKYRLLNLGLDEKYAAIAEVKRQTKVDKAKVDADEDIKLEQAKYAAIAQFANEAFSIMASFRNAAMKRELKAAGDDEDKKEAIRKKYFEREKRMGIAQAIINGAIGITAAWKNPYAAPFIIPLIAASTAAQVAMIATQSFASGGIVSGPTLGLVGEYAGAKNNPEVIAPLDKLKELLGGQSDVGEVVFRIDGSTLVGVLEKQIRKDKSFS